MTLLRLPLLLSAALLVGTYAYAETMGQVPPELQRQILATPGTEIVGPQAAPTRVVEYFDYNCSFCRSLAPHLVQLQKDTPSVNITFKEWPIFGGISVYAAKSALAAQYQGKYLKAHEALIGGARLKEEAQVDDILRQAGVDLKRLKQDLTAHAAEINAVLDRNAAEAHALGLRGTPGLLVGRNLEGNIEGLADLKAAVGRSNLVPRAL